MKMKVRRQEGGLYAILCPACQLAHAVDSRWTFNGDFDLPTFRPSIRVHGWLNDENPDGQCHSMVTDGMISFFDDCTHALKGQTVPLEAF